MARSKHGDSRLAVEIREANGTLWFSIRLSGEPSLMHEFSELPSDCGSQKSAVALSVALAIDALSPELRGARTSTAPWLLTIDGVVTTPLPEAVAFGGSVGVNVPVARWFWPRVALFGVVSPNERLRSEAGQFDTWLTVVRAEGCFAAHPHPRLDLLVCAGPWLGALTTIGRGLVQDQTQSDFWSGLGAALELHMRVTRAFGFHIGTDGVVPLRRTKVQVLDHQGQIASETELSGVLGSVRIGPTVFF